jgi:regulator of protease activity HflC (stomatin/prohibitin superfamily)
LNVSCETKTKDNVFVRVEVAVQFRVIVVSSRNINCHQLNRG